MDWNQLWNTLVGWATSTGVKIIVALILLPISFRLITVITRRFEKKLIHGRHAVDKTLTKTLMYVLSIVLKCLVVICLIGYLGIDTSGLTALVASLGVGFGLAVNGAVANIAGGVLILITRPFRVDDFIEAEGFAGTVEDIHITHTRLRTPDNKIIYIPNGTLSSDAIVNYSVKDTRRVEVKLSIAYESDFEKAKGIVMSLCEAHELVLKEPAPFVRVTEHAASSLTLTARVWVKSEDYWTVNFDLLEAAKKAFDENGIEIPFEQIDVHVKKD